MAKKKIKKAKVTKPKFKVGDDVFTPDDKIGTITDIIPYCKSYTYGLDFLDGRGITYYAEIALSYKHQNVKEQDEPKLYETSFKHKYKVGDRVLHNGSVYTIEHVGIIYGNHKEIIQYSIDDDEGILFEQNIQGLAPKELLSREEKQLLREEIQRCYDRWDECPEITAISVYRPNEEYTVICLIDKTSHVMCELKVSSKLFKALKIVKEHSLKELGIED